MDLFFRLSLKAAAAGEQGEEEETLLLICQRPQVPVRAEIRTTWPFTEPMAKPWSSPGLLTSKYTQWRRSLKICVQVKNYQKLLAFQNRPLLDHCNCILRMQSCWERAFGPAVESPVKTPTALSYHVGVQIPALAPDSGFLGRSSEGLSSWTAVVHTRPSSQRAQSQTLWASEE